MYRAREKESLPRICGLKCQVAPQIECSCDVHLVIAQLDKNVFRIRVDKAHRRANGKTGIEINGALRSFEIKDDVVAATCLGYGIGQRALTGGLVCGHIPVRAEADGGERANRKAQEKECRQAKIRGFSQ